MNIKILMMLLFCLCFSPLTYAGQVSVGNIVDQVLETDIEATIDGFPIPSMNISGYTVVVAEDLRNYGFDVVWNPVDKTLIITKNNKRNIKPLATNKSEKIFVGKKIGDVLHTDIKTYLNGKVIQSYNIDGSTAILVSDLSVWGNVQWNPDARIISFTSNVPASGEITETEDDKTDNCAVKIEKMATINLDLNFEGQKYYFEGEEVGFNNQFAMISLEFLARKLGYNITEGGTKNDPVFTIQKDNYSFKINGKTNKVQRYFSGLLYQTDDLDIKPIEKKGVLYISDLDADFVFGLRKAWDEQTGNLHLIYSDYTVKDYGIYDIMGEQFTIHSSIDDDSSAYNCFVYNKTLDLHSNMSGHSDMETGKFVHQASVMLASGHNELELTVVYDGRILMLKTIKNITPDYELNSLNLENMIGPSTWIKISKPLQGYVETTESEIPLLGELTGADNNYMRVEIKKLDETSQQFVEINSQSIEIKDTQFDAIIRFGEGVGLYKVSGYASVPYRYGQSGEAELFKVFVRYID